MIARAAALAALALALLVPAARAEPSQPIDQRFEDTALISGLDAPTTMRFAPDGDIYVAEKAGLVVRYDAPDYDSSEVVVDLHDEVADFVDRGLLGLELDPHFGVNHRLYLLYTFDGPPEADTPRGTDCAGVPDGNCIVSGKLVAVNLPALGEAQPGDIQPLIEHEWCQQFTSHSIGTVINGPDGQGDPTGALYVGGGEGANFDQTDWGQFGSPPNPCGDPPAGKGHANAIPDAEGGSLRAQDVRTSGPNDPTGLSGTIIRVDPANGDPLPGGHFTADENAKRIVAYGMRNPFRFTFRPGTPELWVADVGELLWEELDRIPDVNAGADLDYGWPCIEGNEVADKWRPLNLCTDLDKTTPAPSYRAPYYTCSHSHPVVDGDNCPINTGSALSGVAFQTADAGWPAEYDGGLFFGDFARGCIWFMPAKADGEPDASRVRLFSHGPPRAGAVDLRIGPDGALYYVYWDTSGTNVSQIRRIAFTGHAPHAALTADPTSGAAPLDVHFDASGSTDPDGQALHYAWDLDGDGAFDDAPDAPTAERTYAAGDVDAGVRVTDPDGLTSTRTVTIHAGNTPPVPVIDTPVAGTTFSVGDQIAFHGSATDSQDGTLPASQLSWKVRIAHCPASGCHFHDLTTPPPGAGGTFTAIDHELPSHLEITLTATDSRGLSASVTRDVQPNVATVRVATQPSGIPVRVLGAAPAPSPQQAAVMENAMASIAVPPSAVVGGITRTFVHWDDGSTAVDRVVPVHGTTVRTAIYASPPILPPVLTPGPTVTPGSPHLTVTLRAAHRLHVARRLRVRLGCSVRCTASTAARLRGIPRRLRHVRVSTRRIGAGREVTLTLRLSRGQLAAVRHAHHRVSLRIVTTATAAGGRAVHARRTIRLVR